MAYIQTAMKIEKDMQFFAFPYTIADETKEIVELNDSFVHFWIFSGVIPYTIARQTNVSPEKMEYIYHASNEMYFEILQYILSS